MNTTIVSMDQRLLLNGRSVLTTYLTLRLPDGTEFSVEISDEVAERIVMLNTSSYVEEDGHVVPQQPQESVEPTSFEGDVFGGEDADQVQEDMIEWEQLPDDQLAPSMKKLLRDNNVPAVILSSDLVAIVDQLAERIVTRSQQPTVGQVQRVQARRPKTVPKNELGYPIVQNDGRDPGEVALMGTDEDGVPQA